MSFVRSFEDFYPPKRYDDSPFTEAVIEESAEESAGYKAIETFALEPVDSDPEDPRARSFTTTKATLEDGWYRIAWKDASGATFTSEPIEFSTPNTTYATPAELREALDVTAEMLPDADAAKLIHEAEDLIDERLGARPVDDVTGRKVVPAEEDGWRVTKLSEATVEVARVIYEDPDVARRQRLRSVSGDVATSSPYGPAYGERADALLNQSGLRVNRARMSGSARPMRSRHFS